jgi:hypothetical protein
MKQKIRQFISAFILALGFAAFVPVAAVGAVDVYEPCANNADTAVCASTGDNVNEIVKTVINVLLFVVGLISVIMIIISGISYATSGGDSGAVSKAKNTLLYAVIGLVVAFLAYAIVNWVIGLF